MKVLVIGNGGREHALVEAISVSPRVRKIYCAPGNAGTAQKAENINLQVYNVSGLVKFAHEQEIDLTVVGPEIPLMIGIVDEFQKNGLTIFGPTAAAARLETSKIFAKQIMQKYGIPTANFVLCENRSDLIVATAGKAFPYVIKVDGLAAGKGALVILNATDLANAIHEIYDEDKFGEAASQVLVEDFLEGEELSVFAISDGKNFQLLHAAQDHKRAFDGDKGPNTGGMGAYAPAPLATPVVLENARQMIIKPMLDGMLKEGIPYTGVLYCGLMIKDDLPSVVEFNVRFGDPEAQVILPLLESDIIEILEGSARKNIASRSFKLKYQNACTVVLASGGYPDHYEKGKEITGLERVSREVCVFHAGTRQEAGKIVTSGGRVLAVTAMDPELPAAIQKAYTEIEKINFDNKHYRTDIGQKALIRMK
ncbi:MAG: phosphoribosylamine--glycine ligase [Candidatus Marinimicrobia bacterium]|nr:phosphoribosylamine--glycine ligase [Candidatus Neomarinimicrobiota bacterium]